MGIAAQDPELRARLLVDKGAQRVANYLAASAEKLRVFARCIGHADIHGLSTEDIETTGPELANYTNVKHV